MCKFVLWSPTLTQTKSSLANQALSADPLAHISSLNSQNTYYRCYLSREPFQPNLSHSHCAGTEQPQTPLPYLSFSPLPVFWVLGLKGMYHHAWSGSLFSLGFSVQYCSIWGKIELGLWNSHVSQISHNTSYYSSLPSSLYSASLIICPFFRREMFPLFFWPKAISCFLNRVFSHSMSNSIVIAY